MFKRKTIYIAGLILFTLIFVVALGTQFLRFAPDGWMNPPVDSPVFQQIQPVRELLAAVQGAFWPILIVCVLVDILCIVMLVRVSKWEREHPELEEEELHRDGNGWLALITVFVVIAVVVTGMPTGSMGSAMEANREIRQATAGLGDIPAVFSGSGILKSSEAESVELPVGVKILGYTVKNGERVQAGDVLAYVDQNSVLRTMQQIQSLLEEMDQELADSRENTVSENLKAGAKGRVMAIYTQEGQSVAEAMGEYGALLLLSLDGSVKVELESEVTVRVGEAVELILEDGTKLEGKVRQVQDGMVTVTRSDKDMTPGVAVTVITEDGVELGAGILAVSSPLKITGYTGTVEDIRVKVGQKVDAEDTLLRLTDTAELSRYWQLLRQREELVTLLQEMTVLSKDCAVLASQSGIVSGIPADGEYLPPEETAPEVVLQSFETAGSYGLVLLSNVVTTEPPTDPAEPSEPTEPSVPMEPSEPTEPSVPMEPSEPTEPSVPMEPSEPTEPSVPMEPSDPTEPSVPVEPGTPAEPTDPMEPSTPTEPTLPAEPQVVYAGKVLQVSYGALTIQICETPVTGMDMAGLSAMDAALFTVAKQYTPALTVPVFQYVNGVNVPGAVQQLQAGARVLLTMTGETVDRIDFISGTLETPDQGGSGVLGNGSISGGWSGQIPSTGGSWSGQVPSVEQEPELAVYEVEQASICAITPAEVMTLDVYVDELDVLSLTVGQTAQVTLDALPGQLFQGTVQQIHPEGTNSGGNTKFTVTLELPRLENMLEGMNAAVKIEVSRLTQVLAIPAAAVQEDGTWTFVYTGLDPETGEPADPVDIITGASDGEQIQILSGLTNGAVVYYHYAESVTYSNTQK